MAATTSSVPAGVGAYRRRRPEGRIDPGPRPPGRIAVVGGSRNRTNVALATHWRALGLDVALVSAADALELLGPEDLALGRIDVLPSVDGVEPGLLGLLLLERRGVPILNRAFGLLAAHDKLLTERCLAAVGLPRPRTGAVRDPADPLPVSPPLVIKPRFGSWGVDVHRCATEREARACLRALASRPWFTRHGAIVQELVGPSRRDLRLVVAADLAIAAIHRVAAPGEWRTNVALGGTIELAAVDEAARELAIAATRAVGCDLAAVDLLPLGGGRNVVLEVNGAADFEDNPVPEGRDIFRDAAAALGLDRNARLQA
ncbi:MAG: hypothetical protein OEV72_08615 [Thermoleophilia bacterium]|nr:hypothetical protein [Thermoleophilia bacterium]